MNAAAMRNRVVMIVEDDRDVRESIAEVLSDSDFTTITAVNGADALEKLKAGIDEPCLILLDMMMPVMDGWQFRELQRQDPRFSKIPVIVITAHANVRESAEKLGAAGFLRKPVELDDLINEVGKFCH